MKLSDYMIDFLGAAIAGDRSEFPYRSGPQLVRLFNEFGFRDVYPSGGGFPTRRIFAQDRAKQLNGTPKMRALIQRLVDPREYLANGQSIEKAISVLNGQLQYEGFEVVTEGRTPRIREKSAPRVELGDAARVDDDDTQLTIDENVRKCEQKLADGDYTGAITNARSLLEAVLIGLEKDTDSSAPEYDGDLVKLYRRTQKLLNLGPDRKDVSDPLRQVLSGLAGIVNGLAAIRNKMGDAHAVTYRPDRHHAKLAVYAAITLADFLFETKSYQQKKRGGR